MSGVKRTASSRTTRLAARASPYHSSVTLFETHDIKAEGPSDSPGRSKRVKLEPKVEEDDTLQLLDLHDSAFGSSSKTKLEDLGRPTASHPPSPQKRAAKKQPKKPKAIQQELQTPHPAPERWRETYDAIKEMRSGILAPVDTMGCDQAQYKEDDPKNRRFATLVSLMLSSQTKDEVTDAAVSKLRTAVGGSLTVDGIINADEAAIAEAIGKVGFWRRKTQYLRQTAQRLRDDFDSDVPKTVDELCSLPGVGPKMAFLALQVAWNLNLGIGVDVHVHRITNRLGWHKPSTKGPEQTRLNLQSWLPKELHGEINHMLVGFGQVICLPIGPRCDSCTLSSNGLCPSAQKVKSKTRKTVVISAVPPASAESPPKIEIALEMDTLDSMKSESPLSALEN